MSDVQRHNQTAMEFIMTYGWAIVAIVVALGVMYSLGIFNIGNGATSGCTAVVGFSCTKPVLYSGGVLQAGFGIVGTGRIITATGCSLNADAPDSNWIRTSITLQSGQIVPMNFSCPVTTSTQIGGLFYGTLWVNYTNIGGGQVYTAPAAAVRVAVTSSALTYSSYVPITLQNSQGTSAPNGFQEMIQFNPSTYTANEASNLGNIRFYQGDTELYSWCESGCTNGASSAIFWVDVASGIPSSSSTVINMAFLSNTLNYDGIYAGEAPQLSPSYGEYDNGAEMFPSLYGNFAGTGNYIPSPWACLSNCGNITTNNMFISKDSNTLSDPIEADIPNLKMNDTITDAYIEYKDPTPCSGLSCTEQTTLRLSETALAWEYQASPWSWCSSGNMCPFPEQAMYLTTQLLPPNQWGVISMSDINMTGGSYETDSELNYAGWTGSLYSCGGLACSNKVFMDMRYSNVTLDVQWLRMRDYPPSGVMPTATFGNVI